MKDSSTKREIMKKIFIIIARLQAEDTRIIMYFQLPISMKQSSSRVPSPLSLLQCGFHWLPYKFETLQTHSSLSSILNGSKHEYMLIIVSISETGKPRFPRPAVLMNTSGLILSLPQTFEIIFFNVAYSFICTPLVKVSH